MAQRPDRLRGAWLLFSLSLASAAACGGGDARNAVLSGPASIPSLQHAGWRAQSAVGMPRTASGVPQVSYLQLVSPDHVTVDVQFLPSSADASTERKAAEAQITGFHGSTVDNALVFTDPDGHAPVPRALLASPRAAALAG